jgi:hypothetical protein
MIINYDYKDRDFKLFFLKKNLKLIHNSSQEINNRNMHGESPLDTGI